MHYLIWIGILFIGLGTIFTIRGQLITNDRSSKIIVSKSNKINELSQKIVQQNEEMKKLITNQTDEIELLKVFTLSTNEKINDLNTPQEVIHGKMAQFEVKAIPSFAEDFLLIFKSNLGLITGYVRVKGAKELYRFSTKGNDQTPVVIHSLWLPQENKYQYPPVLELIIDHQSDEKAVLNVFTKGWLFPKGM